MSRVYTRTVSKKKEVGGKEKKVKEKKEKRKKRKKEISRRLGCWHRVVRPGLHESIFFSTSLLFALAPGVLGRIVRGYV